MNDQAKPRPSVVEPGVATAEDGHVLLDGPDGVALTMSPEAALATAESLRAAAEKAIAERDRR